MKRKLLFTVLFCLATLFTFAEVKTVHLNFTKEMFHFDFDSSNVLNISANNVGSMNFSYNENPDEPGYPILSLQVKMAKGAEYKSFTQSTTKSEIFNDVTIVASPWAEPMSQDYTAQYISDIPRYTKAKYPYSHVKYITTTTLEDSVVFHFQVYPFEYDALNKKLYLINNVTININLNNKISTNDQNKADFINYCATRGIGYDNFIATQSTNDDTDSIDYLIITSDELAYYFNPFVKWKKTKGVRTKVVTIEDIQKSNSSNSSLSLADQIKSYILYLYHIKGYKLKYLLLGGDNSIVPSKMCYSRVVSTKYNNKTKKTNTIVYEDNIPADIFYASLDYTKDAYWDHSKNGIYGELEDSINFSQDIFVTRLPVNTSTDVKTALMKLVSYEQNPAPYGWNNSILMAGMKLFVNTSDEKHSDAEKQGDYIYNGSIKNYWNGERKKLYDTYSDFENDGIKTITKANFQKVISQGFAFVDMQTHGNNSLWSLPDRSYTSSDAVAMTSSQYSVITTTACHTNAFDKAEPCLSEAFIRNPNSGVVAYLGSSRFGWGVHSAYILGTSSEYEQAFYKYLFDNTLKDKNFGKVVAYAKSSRVSDRYTASRWLQFSLNPIGDAEMPIYTTTPQNFDKSIIKRTPHSVSVYTGVDSCNICIMSSKDDGVSCYKVYKNVSEVSDFAVNTDLTICITKQNFIPKIYNVSSIRDVKDKIIYGAFDNNNQLLISTQLADNIQTANVIISNTNGDKEKTYTISKENSSITDDASEFKNGVHIVSMFVNGKLTDSIQLRK